MIQGARTPLTVDLTGIRVAITAGANGIGKVMADSFASCGADVFVSDLDDAALAACGHAGMRADAGVAAECFGFPLRAPYAAAKWGVVGFTKSLSIELGPDGVRVNAILPGPVDGPRIRAVIKAKALAARISENEMTERTVATTSLKAFVTQQDIANMALYLASPFGTTISGQAISVDADMQYTM